MLLEKYKHFDQLYYNGFSIHAISFRDGQANVTAHTVSIRMEMGKREVVIAIRYCRFY